MKKIVIMSFFAIIILLSACSKNDTKKSVDFKSMLDTESDKIVSIGDEKVDVDKNFGEPTYNEGQYDYPNGLSITYLSGKVVAVEAYLDKFEIIGYTVGMNDEEIVKNFEKSAGNTGDWVFYNAYYDDAGNRCVEDLSIYYNSVIFNGDTFDSIFVCSMEWFNSQNW